MTSGLCHDDVVVHISGSQMMSSETSCIAVRRGCDGAELGRRLLAASRAGDTTLVLELMAKGSPFTTDWLGTSPLHLAASGGHADTCSVLLRAGVSRDSRTKVERTPLHLAAYAGHERVVALLLDHGALLDCRDMLRMTPLHWAVQRGHVGAARELLRRGADLTAVSKFGATPTSLADRAPPAARGPLLQLLEETSRAREASCSVRALVTEQIAEEPQTHDTAPQLFETVHKTQDGNSTPKRVKPIGFQRTDIPTTIKIEQSAENKQQEESEREGAAAQLLRRHGITLLPADNGTTVLSALQSGRSVVLSDAGKLMLKESGEKSSGNADGGAKGVVLTATPVQSPPRAGVKIFTLNNNLLLPAANGTAKTTNKSQDLQVKYMQVPKGTTAGRGGRRVSSRPVKIILNRANFSKLLAPLQTATSTATPTRTEADTSGRTGATSIEDSDALAQAENVLSVPDEWVDHCTHKQLRAHTVQARSALAMLLRHCRTTR